jgi:serine/threonine protein kinase
VATFRMAGSDVTYNGMPREDLADPAIELTDGASVDSDAQDQSAYPTPDGGWSKWLRVSREIAGAERSPMDETCDGAVMAAPAPEDPDATTETGTDTWGGFRLVEKVGEGGFGSVFRAWDPELEREVAIKILHRRVADGRLKERLLREGRALAKIRHPHVVTVFGIETHGDQAGLCMEFVQGETLEVALRTHGTLNAREAALVGEDLCRALAAVHAAGFVHRDVKARNVMRERAGRVVLMDFGTGLQVDEIEGQNHVNLAGTPLYMAPEVLALQPASACSDVYSVGVLLYHLVTGAYPVEGRTMDELRTAYMQGRRRLLSERRPDLPNSFIEVIARSLAVDPSQRYPTAAALLEALAAVSGELQPKPQPHPARSIPTAVAAGASVASFVIGLGIVSSREFNLALQRSGFVDETLWDWFIWGARSCVGPATLVVLAVLVGVVAIVVHRILVSTSAAARRIEAAVRADVRALSNRLRLDDVNGLASAVLLVCAAALAGGWWYFVPLIGALFNVASTAPAQDLVLLSPDFAPYHENYRIAFTWIAIGSIVAWYPVVRLAARRCVPINKGLMVGGATVALLALALLDFPYRMLNFSTGEIVSWQREECNIIGERPDAVLLFCPGLQPRNRIVKKTDASLRRTGVEDSIFRSFSKQRQHQKPL